MTMSVPDDENGQRAVVVAAAERIKQSDGQNIFLISRGNMIMNRALTFSSVSKTVTCCKSVFVKVVTTGHKRCLSERDISQVRMVDRWESC